MSNESDGPDEKEAEGCPVAGEEAITNEEREFILYPLGGARPDMFLPSDRLRDWQLDTRGQFAVRCLPLNIANCQGWEGTLDGSFDVIWNGGPSIADLEVIPHGDGPVSAESHFGEGVLTFHTGFLFRTPPGHNMMIMGPVNQPNDGRQPLLGIIETDWAPYSTTMNWRFTRPCRVTFKKGDPFCHIMPIPRGYTESFRPVIRDPEKHEPGLMEDFHLWSRSRDDFNKALHERDPETVKKGWQKLYYRGLYPGEERKECAHQTKIRLKEFEDLSEFDFERTVHAFDKPRGPISACVSVLNDEASIRGYLDHVAPRVTEVLICDLGSIDGTREIIESLPHSNVKILEPHPDKPPLQDMAEQAAEDTLLLLQPEDRLPTPFWKKLPDYLDELSSGNDCVEHDITVSAWDDDPLFSAMEFTMELHPEKFVPTGLRRISLCKKERALSFDATTEIDSVSSSVEIQSVLPPNHKMRSHEYLARKILADAKLGAPMDDASFEVVTQGMSEEQIAQIREDVANANHSMPQDIWWGEVGARQVPKENKT